MTLLGDAAPEFTLDGTAGGSVTLSDTLDAGPTVLLFNRGVWCSYCAEQLQTFSELEYDLWRHHDVDAYGILSEPVPDLVEMQDRFDLRVQLLADTSLEVSARYTDVEENGTYGQIPIPGTFIVDTEGTVRYEHVAVAPPDRTYANYVRHLLNNGYEPPYDAFGPGDVSI